MTEKTLIPSFQAFVETLQLEEKKASESSIKAISAGEYSAGSVALERAAKIVDLRKKVMELKHEWEALFGSVQSTAKVPRKTVSKKTPVVQSKPQKRQRGKLIETDQLLHSLFQALVEFGGSAAKQKVVTRVSELLEKQLRPHDLEPSKWNPHILRWQAKLDKLYAKLIKEGLVSSGSAKGKWVITDAGKAALAAK